MTKPKLATVLRMPGVEPVKKPKREPAPAIRIEVGTVDRNWINALRAGRADHADGVYDHKAFDGIARSLVALYVERFRLPFAPLDGPTCALFRKHMAVMRPSEMARAVEGAALDPWWSERTPTLAQILAGAPKFIARVAPPTIAAKQGASPVRCEQCQTPLTPGAKRCRDCSAPTRETAAEAMTEQEKQVGAEAARRLSAMFRPAPVVEAPVAVVPEVLDPAPRVVRETPEQKRTRIDKRLADAKARGDKTMIALCERELKKLEGR